MFPCESPHDREVHYIGFPRGVNLFPTLWGSKDPLLSSPPLPLEVSSFNPARGSGNAVSSPSGVWDEAPVANDFGAFSGWRNAAGGVQDARFETPKTGISLRFYEEIFQYYCKVPAIEDLHNQIIVRVWTCGPPRVIDGYGVSYWYSVVTIGLDAPFRHNSQTWPTNQRLWCWCGDIKWRGWSSAL